MRFEFLIEFSHQFIINFLSDMPLRRGLENGGLEGGEGGGGGMEGRGRGTAPHLLTSPFPPLYLSPPPPFPVQRTGHTASYK